MSALHHRQNNKYIRPYLPYLPLFLIMGGSLAAGQYLPHSSFNSASNAGYSSRVQTAFGSNSARIIDIAYIILAVLIVWFIVRHYKIIKSVIIKEEKLLAKHYFFDALLAVMIGLMFLLIT
jgi:hypothetical protein